MSWFFYKIGPGEGLEPSRPELDAGICYQRAGILKGEYIKGSNFRYKKTSYKLVLL